MQSIEKNTIKNLNGTVAVRDGKIIVENPIGAGEYAKVILMGECELQINGKKVTKGSIVKEDDEIVFEKESIPGKRYININTNDDNTEARIDISYELGFKYEIKNKLKDLCVAVSIPVQETVQDTVKTIYNSNKCYNNQENMKNIDYKNIISIESVKKGDVIAEIINGRIGKDGLSIYNKKIKASPYREIRFKIGSGCKLEGNNIIATNL